MAESTVPLPLRLVRWEMVMEMVVDKEVYVEVDEVAEDVSISY